MEQVLEGLGTVLRALLGLAFVVGPGMLFWLAVAGIIMAIRWVSHRSPFQRVNHQR
jgi:hypothetical protein